MLGEVDVPFSKGVPLHTLKLYR